MRVILVPLDDRPCNIQFPSLLPYRNIDLCITPRSIMGNMKKSADISALKSWLLSNITNSDYLIISLDTLIYGGLIPSRLHHKKLEELIDNLNFIKELKTLKPTLKIYSYLTIMRTPNSNYDSEEPKYYSTYGKKIFRLGVLRNKEKLNIITKEEKEELLIISNDIPKRIISDYTKRRKTNLKVLLQAYNLYLDNY